MKKGGNGVVYVPLSPDDPLYDPASPHTNFMVMTRASVDGAGVNVTTPWVDQNQTYTSHASHQVFLREYVLDLSGRPVATGHLLDGDRGLPTWGDVKEQARTMLGIELTDADVGMVPLIRTDAYGKFIPDPVTGFAQVIVGLGADGIPNTADDAVFSGTPSAPVSLANAVRLPIAFLDDIAHAAATTNSRGQKMFADHDDDLGIGVETVDNPYFGVEGAPSYQMANLAQVAINPDFNPSLPIGAANPEFINPNRFYDNELLDAHYITGDGRGNENIGLSAVHHVFHAEHNRMVDQVKEIALSSGDLAFLNEWLRVDVASMPTTPAQIAALQWDGERVFQAARFSTEMQYQHLVFEEFARKVQPDIDIFMIQPDVEINPAILAEFAHVIYRFGHSMLNETVDRINADGSRDDITLFDAFLNPLAFGSETVDHREAAGAIIRGMSGQVGNEIDEFVTNVLRNQLVGIPLDLAAINIARGRDTGMPTLNEARAQFQTLAGGDTQLDPYASWTDFALNLKNPESIVNFIAAYGDHASITAESSIAGKRDAAMKLVFGGAGAPADRLDFLNATGAYANKKGGLDDVDLWVGGLAEKKMPFGGMLGSTFAFIFEMQMEKLQHADRFYYLSRVQGLHLLTALENNSLAKMVLRNTDLGETGFALPGDIFSTPDHILYVDYNKQMQMTGIDDPQHDNPFLEAVSKLVQRIDADGDGVAEYIRYNGADHVVIQGTDGDDHIVAGGGDDTVWGGAGNDRIEAGYGVDHISGGAGDDIITNAGTDIGETDMLKGDDGNDVIHGGSGLALIFGGRGQDYLMTGPDGSEIRAGLDNDFLIGGEGADILFGNEGDDWIEGRGAFDYIAGDNGELFFNSTIIGHDVLNGGSGDTDYDADSGDDIMFGGEGIQKFIGMWGHDWVIYKGQQTPVEADMRIEVFTTLPLEVLRDRFSQVEAVSGWIYNDWIAGDDRTSVADAGGAVADPTPETNFQNNELDQAGIARIAGLDQIVKSDLLQTVQYWADGSGATKLAFIGGNILLGGGGSDVIEGRGGDDIIDGDRWLNVRVTGTAKDGATFSVNSLDDDVTLGGVTKKLTSWMIEGAINPGTLQIVREILDGDQAGDEDTAVYWDVRDNYDITQNADGSLTISHITQTAGAVDPLSGRNRVSDGTDRLYNIEWLQFADGRISTGIFNNDPATGAPVINDLTPTQGQTLSINTSSIQDLQGLGPFTYQWQVSADGGATWQNIAALVGGNSPTFTPNNGLLGFGGQVGDILRVVVSFVDGAGNLETVVSAPTGVVGANWSGLPLVNNTFNGTAGDDIATGVSPLIIGGNDTLNGLAGDDQLNGAGGNDVLNGGQGNDRLDGGAGTDTAVYSGAAFNFNFGLNASNQLTVTDLTGAEGVDTLIAMEQLRYGGVNYTLVNGTVAGQTLNGGAGTRADIILGHAGADTLNGNAGNDILVGGAGNDTVSGGDGADLMLWRVGDGRDFLNGGAGTDTVHVAGDASAEVFRIYTRTEALAAGLTGLNGNTEIVITRNGATNASIIAELDNVEEIIINGHGGGDTFITVGDFTGTSLAMSTITLEGGAGNDRVDISALRSAHRIVFRSNGGDDTVVGALRPQDVVELPWGANLFGALADAADGAARVGDEAASITFDKSSSYSLKSGDESRVIQASSTAPTDDPGSGGDSGGHDDDHDDDDMIGDSRDNSITGSHKADVIMGLSGNDILKGGAGDDKIYGGSGADHLLGQAGDDQLFGGSGNDRLEGGAGDDVLIGGAGNDTFIFDAGFGDDIILDFDANPQGGQDLLDISALGVTAADFASRVSIKSIGGDTIITIDGQNSITLVDVSGRGRDAVTVEDFKLAESAGGLLQSNAAPLPDETAQSARPDDDGVSGGRRHGFEGENGAWMLQC
ncbi:MAG: hypothetical protein KF700_05700 [Hyphomonadaceae bacterium]|nr:hypothetical protein [Hyphomonadaceae bacterium]